MMFVFIQFCFYIICQSRIWCKGYEERLKILFPEVVSLIRLTHPNSLIVFYVMAIIIKLKRICTYFVGNVYLQIIKITEIFPFFSCKTSSIYTISEY